MNFEMVVGFMIILYDLYEWNGFGNFENMEMEFI